YIVIKYFYTILFLDQQIDIEALQYIKDSHIAILLKNFPLRIHIKFEHYIEQFQKKCKSDESNLNPDNMTWPEIEEIWRKTINYKLQFIKKYNTAEIFNKWQHYTKPMGYKLIGIDFHKIYSRYSCFITKFEEASSKLIKILDERIKDC
ncbi:unnamed protein product, partial [Aphis gossypii]